MPQPNPAVNKRYVTRIDAALPDVSDHFEKDKLAYIRSQLTDAGYGRRSDEDADVSHLREEAGRIIKRFSRKEPIEDVEESAS